LLAKVAEETSNVDTTNESTDENQQLPPKRKRKQPDHLYDSEDGDGKSLTKFRAIQWQRQQSNKLKNVTVIGPSGVICESSPTSAWAMFGQLKL